MSRLDGPAESTAASTLTHLPRCRSLPVASSSVPLSNTDGLASNIGVSVPSPLHVGIDGPRSVCAVSTRILGKPIRDAARNMERWKRRRTPAQYPSTDLTPRFVHLCLRLLARGAAVALRGCVCAQQPQQLPVHGVELVLGAAVGLVVRTIRDGLPRIERLANKRPRLSLRLCIVFG